MSSAFTLMTGDQVLEYKLDNVAGRLGLPDFRHHRADDDAYICGRICERFFDMLAEKGVEAEILKLGFLSPLDMEPICASAQKTGRLIVFEETAELCDREIALLRLLAARRGEALARDWLALKLWGKNAAVSDNLLSVLVYGLRGKLAAEGQAIRTVRGVGYVFAPSS